MRDGRGPARMQDEWTNCNRRRRQQKDTKTADTDNKTKQTGQELDYGRNAEMGHTSLPRSRNAYEHTNKEEVNNHTESNFDTTHNRYRQQDANGTIRLRANKRDGTQRQGASIRTQTKTPKKKD